MADVSSYADLDAKADLSLNEALLSSNKRKRDSLDTGANSNRSAPHQRGNSANAQNASDLNDQATANFLAAHNASGSEGDMGHTGNSLDFNSLAQHQNGGNNSSDTAAAALHYSMTVPQATELSFQSQVSAGDDFSGLDALKNLVPPSTANESPTGSLHKPAVGTDEWHKLRRDNHKEVERRRRETINEGINELAKIVPGCEKNKGSILQRAVQFITQLKENESQNIEKWTLEKLLTEQAITELSASVDKFKAEMQRAWDECEVWKRACNNAGVAPDEYKNQEGNNQNGDS